MAMLHTIAQGFWFVHPAIAGAAVVATVIPIAIHLLHRWNHKRVPWAAMRFLLAARQQSKRRIWIHNYLLLLLRIALIALLGFAVARPFSPSSANLGVGSNRGHHILVLDNSLSMSATVDDATIRDATTRFDRAKKSAANLLASMPKGDAVSLVSAVEPAKSPLAYASYDRRVAEEILAATLATQRPANWSGVWSKVNEILDDSDSAPGQVTVHILSDFDQSHWLHVDSKDSSGSDGVASSAVAGVRQLAERLSHDQHQLILIGLGDTPTSNLAVTKLNLASSVVSPALPMQLLVEITNFGKTLIDAAQLTVALDSQSMHEQALPAIGPGQTVAAAVMLAATSPGIHLVEASLQTTDSDALAVDNTRYLSIEIPKSVRILLIDGKPGRSILAGETGFLSAALSPESIGSGSMYDRSENQPSASTTIFAPKVISPAALDREALDEYGAMVLCNVATLSLQQWRQLESAVSAGVGLAIFAGDRLDPDQYNTFAYANGKGLLPGRLSTAQSRDNDTSEPLRFQRDDPPHEVIQELASLADSGLFLATVDRYVPIEPKLDNAETILRYTNGQPAVVGSKFGTGRVLYCSFSANMSWTNLPSKGDFVSFVLHLTTYLTSPTDSHRNLLVGQAIVEPIQASKTSFEAHAVDPQGQKIDTDLELMDEQLALIAGAAEQAGPWTLIVGPDRYPFAVNVDTKESDLRMTSADQLRSSFDTPNVVVLDDPNEIDARLLKVKSTELVLATTSFVLGLLLIEAWLAMRLGPGRRNKQPVSLDRHMR